MCSAVAGPDLPVSRVAWSPCYRIIPSRFPPIQLFQRVADPADLEAVIAVESLTNERIRDQVGELHLVPVEECIAGPGSSVIMAAFTHRNPEGSRFSDGSYGVFYAGAELETAVAETRYHRERFMGATSEPPMELDMRVYLTDLDGELHDLRGLRGDYPGVYHPENYAEGQALGGALRAQGAGGIVYESVRRTESECVAVFRPPLLSNCRQGPHLSYVWDGARISHVYEKRLLDV
ncbi:MAG: RES family NAD+ phosphorylase [Pseudomonadota bacterium]|nr:RES family NAD+ phosphorylase [Pseudomonadota bacterium]